MSIRQILDLIGRKSTCASSWLAEIYVCKQLISWNIHVHCASSWLAEIYMCIVHAADWLKYSCPNSWTILVQAVGCMKSACASSWLAENPLVHAADWLKIHLCKQLIGWKSTCASSWLAEKHLMDCTFVGISTSTKTTATILNHFNWKFTSTNSRIFSAKINWNSVRLPFFL